MEIRNIKNMSIAGDQKCLICQKRKTFLNSNLCWLCQLTQWPR
ncbi:MAG: hypothetical protein MRERV_1c107 [Mycoplasmataceae bacterium RV_VA103A]|nr:MAG: hypothetical protein MRERV_10c003 [Mycoplasmataceae bacterium RV_VA103A]KLL05418.1 MAG: hypothetical protein MRERV_1c107 [Mycoplasmataceae bacterium RV_VA103A]